MISNNRIIVEEHLAWQGQSNDGTTGPLLEIYQKLSSTTITEESVIASFGRILIVLEHRLGVRQVHGTTPERAISQDKLLRNSLD